MNDTVEITLKLTVVEAKVLYDKLDILCRECFHGIDIWLAPGGTVNKDAWVFLTPDPVYDSIAIDAIHTKLQDVLNIDAYKKDYSFMDPDTNEPLEFDCNGVSMKGLPTIKDNKVDW